MKLLLSTCVAFSMFVARRLAGGKGISRRGVRARERRLEVTFTRRKKRGNGCT